MRAIGNQSGREPTYDAESATHMNTKPRLDTEGEQWGRV
jgi:hypothetical protein